MATFIIFLLFDIISLQTTIGVYHHRRHHRLNRIIKLSKHEPALAQTKKDEFELEQEKDAESALLNENKTKIHGQRKKLGRM